VKHLVAILAHKNPANVAVLIAECIQRNFEVLIHIDAKSREDFMSNPSFSKYSNLVVDQAIDVKRAHFSIVEATQLLMKRGLKVDFDYFHLISGEDIPVKSEIDFATFFEKNKGLNFINHFTIPVTSPYSQVRSEIFNSYSVFKDRLPKENYTYKFFKNGIGLVDTFHFPEVSLLGKQVKKLTRFNTFKKMYHFVAHRNLPILPYVGGSGWFSITKEMVNELVKYSEQNPKIYQYFKHSLFPDEIYYQTIALQSRFKNTIINSDLRYINWNHPKNHGPGFLTLEEVPSIKNSNGFFARKLNLNSTPNFIDNLKD
jgi:hypothetical protein